MYGCQLCIDAINRLFDRAINAFPVLQAENILLEFKLHFD